MSEVPYPHESAPASHKLLYIAEHLEQLAMCFSCEYHGGVCPKGADAERPCSEHVHKDNLIAENLTDDLKMMETAIVRVKDLEAFLENSLNEEKES